MSGFARWATAFAALASFLGAMTATAGAVTWHNTGSTSFTATAGAGTMAVTGSGGTNNVSCTHATATGTIPGGSTVGTVLSVTGTGLSTPCSLSGTPVFAQCTYTLTAFAYTAPVTTGNARQHCVVRVDSGTTTALCTLEGSVPGHYVNPIGATPGRVTSTAANTVIVTHASGTSCASLLGTFTSAVAHVTHKSLNITGGNPSPFGPIINRTP